jgi:predicted phage tail protein
MILPFDLEMDFAFAYLALKSSQLDKVRFQLSIQSLVAISRFSTRVGDDVVLASGCSRY